MLVNPLGEDLARVLAILIPRARGLGLDNDAGWDMLELNGGVGFVLPKYIILANLRMENKGCEGNIRSSVRQARCPSGNSPRCRSLVGVSAAAGGLSLAGRISC